MATMRLIRLRAGFYITRGAEYRIVRRKYDNREIMRWCIDVWSHDHLRWLAVAERPTLKEARTCLGTILCNDGSAQA